jgi:hypothetical protein
VSGAETRYPSGAETGCSKHPPLPHHPTCGTASGGSSSRVVETLPGVFLGGGFRLGLPSHPASQRRSCLRLGVSTISSSRGLSPPIDHPCRAYSRRRLWGAEVVEFVLLRACPLGPVPLAARGLVAVLARAGPASGGGCCAPRWRHLGRVVPYPISGRPAEILHSGCGRCGMSGRSWQLSGRESRQSVRK